MNLSSRFYYTVLACIICTGSATLFAAKTESVFKTANEAIRSIVSTHTRVFSKENLLLSAIAPEDHQAWETLITNLKDYVREKQPDILRYSSNTLFQIAEQLESTISSIFTEDISPAFTNEKAQREGVSASGITQKIDYSKINLNRSKLKLKSIETKLLKLKNFKKNLDDIQKFFKSKESKKSAYQKAKEYVSGPKTAAAACAKDPQLCQVLDTLASVLDATIDKAVRDFEKLKTGLGIS